MINKGYPVSFIENLKQKCDIVSVLSHHLTLQKKGKTFWACCPFHYEKTPSFAVNQDEQYYHCFGCGESGDVVKFIQKYENLTFTEAVKYLADSVGLALPELSSSQEEVKKMKQKADVYEALKLSMNFYKECLLKPEAANAREYLKMRGIGSEICEKFGIGYSPDWNTMILALEKNNVSKETMKLAGLIEFNDKNKPYDVFAMRLMFPILNANGDCIAYTARTLQKDSSFAKYRNSTQTLVFDKSRTIYNLNTIKDLKKAQELKYIIICEGTIDVIAMYKAGFKNTVACMGTAITSQHASELKKYCDKIILCLDGDKAGQNAMYKAIDVLLDAGLEVKVVKLSDNLDPDEYLKKFGADKLKQNIASAIDAIEFKIFSLATNYDLEDNFQKNRYINNALEIISKLEGSTQKEIYLKVLASKVGVSADILRRDLYQGGVATLKESSPVLSETSKADYIVREAGLTKALKFVLASAVHKKEYVNISKLDIDFKNSNYNNLLNFVKDSVNQNKPYLVSTLFDQFEVDENPDIKEIIDFDFSEFTEPEVYYNECLKKITLVKLTNRQDELKQQFKTERDNAKRLEIAGELNKIAKQIKLETEQR